MSQLKMIAVLFAAPLLSVALGATSASAENFGAIAFSQSSGAVGYSFDYRSRGSAEEHALQECGRGCRVVLWFKDACAAIAVGSGNGYGTGWATTRGGAESIAMNNCNENASNCGVNRWVCTSR
jgi:Domain of unknown function (DUF4189)